MTSQQVTPARRILMATEVQCHSMGQFQYEYAWHRNGTRGLDFLRMVPQEAKDAS